MLLYFVCQKLPSTDCLYAEPGEIIISLPCVQVAEKEDPRTTASMP